MSILALSEAAAMAGSAARTDTILVVADPDSGDRLLELPVDQGQEVTIAYTHSVQKSPVRDVYVVDGGELQADRSVFHSFGAGLPTENVERTEEGYVVDGTDSYGELFVVPGEIAGHELVVSDERYDLVEVADGRVVLFLTAIPVTESPFPAGDRCRRRARPNPPGGATAADDADE